MLIICRRLKTLGLHRLASPGQCLKRLLSGSCFSDLKPLLEHFSVLHVFLTPLPLFTVSADIPPLHGPFSLLCVPALRSPGKNLCSHLRNLTTRVARPLRHPRVPGLPAQTGLCLKSTESVSCTGQLHRHTEQPEFPVPPRHRFLWVS